MERVLRWAILTQIVSFAQSKQYRVGHTLMQKIVYLLQNALNVPLGYSFRIHYYGPYSDDVWQDLRTLDEMKILSITSEEDGYGYNITVSEKSQVFNEKGCGPQVPSAAIERVVQVLGPRDVKTLEIVATTHYVYTFLTSKGCEKSKLVQETIEAVTSLKPHVMPEQVSEAVAVLRNLRWVEE